ncbi:metallophosphoesterase [Novosphingobium sp. H3SJ31-1]|uniref:Metallophosphoesterase n=1 Tax=Novosphingobium album (ex Liu et al. 2023) TaxID=3031130 RepID=A0ABT5WPH5_9SPHN|nr:metallophosphoesterase [Novosphingobium album (ex Liu et al. 2023)]MDE8651656.1 metallophosphoesterase [Novosphingobium album (ex Liu et al. 2023)]
MLIAQLTDIHIGFDRGNPDEYNMRRLKAVVQRLIEGPDEPDLLLLTGDLTEYGDAQSYALLNEALSVCPFPIWPAVGNHDVRAALLAAYPQVPAADGFVQYALEAQGLRLIVLDTLEEGRHGGAFCETRARWLDAELSAHPDTPTLLVMHHPPFASGLVWLDSDEDESWIGRFREAIAGHAQVGGVISGHLHRTIHTVLDSVAYTVVGSTAPAAALDLTPIDLRVPDGRAMITDEPPVFALHRWDGRRVVSHSEAVTDAAVLARYDANFLRVVQLIEKERGEG